MSPFSLQDSHKWRVLPVFDSDSDRVEKLAKTGVFLKVTVYNVSVFIAAEFLQDEHFSTLPGTLQKAGAVYRKKTRGKLASATLYR